MIQQDFTKKDFYWNYTIPAMATAEESLPILDFNAQAKLPVAFAPAEVSQLQGELTVLLLAIDQNDRLQRLQWEIHSLGNRKGEGDLQLWQRLLASFPMEVLGKKVNDLLSDPVIFAPYLALQSANPLQQRPFFHFPLLLLYQAIQSYILGTGDFISGPATLLVCRCFGVTRENIQALIQQQQITTVQQVTQHLRAAGGCRSCFSDIQNLLPQMEKAVQLPRKQVKKLQGMAPVIFYQTVQEELNRWCLENGSHFALKSLQLLKVQEQILYVRFHLGPEEPEESDRGPALWEKAQEQVAQHLLNFFFSLPSFSSLPSGGRFRVLASF